MKKLIEKCKDSDEHDRINSPKHYTSHPSGIECIQVTEYYNFCVGNALKYMWRQGLKDENGLDAVEKQVEDCKKAIWYINRHIMNLQKEKNSGATGSKQDEKMAKGCEKIELRAGSPTHRPCLQTSRSNDAQNVSRLRQSNDLNEGYDYTYDKR